MRSDLELLDAWRGGDKTAGSRLFERHFDALMWFFRNKVGDGLEDLVQDTFLACVQVQPRLRPDSSFRALMFGIARRKLIDRIRAAHRGRGLADADHLSVASLPGSPSAVLVQREEQRLLVHALRRLPLASQILLELHYWEQLTGPELARVLEIPEGTVRSRLRLARAALRRHIEELGRGTAFVESTVSDVDAWARSIRDATAKPDRP